MKILLEQIKVGERDRADLGDIAELAASIEAVGPLHPVVVTESYDLVAGGRRLEAMKLLGWTEVPVTVVDLANAEEVLRAEADENACRKPLTPYEASRARERRARALAPKAVERKAQAPGRPRGEKVSDVSSSNLDEETGAARATRKVAATGTGYSGSTLDKVDKIRDVAERGVIRQGRTEVPAPEPVQAAAREALEEVKVTGAAVDRASKRVEQAISDHIEDSAEVQRAKLRQNWRRAFSAAMELERFDAEQIAHVLEPAEWPEIEIAARSLSAWYARLFTARGDGHLHVVKGGRS